MSRGESNQKVSRNWNKYIKKQIPQVNNRYKKLKNKHTGSRADGRAFVHVALGSRCVQVCQEKLHFRPCLCFVPPTFKRNRKLWHTDVSRPFGFTFAVVVYLQILKTTKCQSSSVYCRTTSAAGCFANSCSSPKDLSYIFKIHFRSLLVYQQYRVDCRWWMQHIAQSDFIFLK